MENLSLFVNQYDKKRRHARLVVMKGYVDGMICGLERRLNQACLPTKYLLT